MSEIPTGWKEAKLGEVAELTLGKMLDREKRKEGTPLPYLRNINVRWNAFALDDLYEMPFKDNELDRFSLQRGDVLICEGGEPGRAAIWNGDDRPIKFQEAILRARPGPDVLPQWIMYSLMRDALSGVLEKYFTGSTIKHFPKVAAARYEFPLPPLPEQRRIVEKVEALLARVNAARDRLTKVPAILKRFRQSILAAAFRGDLTANWRANNPDVEPVSVLLDRIRKERREKWERGELAKLTARGKTPTDDRWKRNYQEPTAINPTDLPELPDGWAWARADAICTSVANGGTPSSHLMSASSGDVPFVKVYNLTFSGELDFSTKPTFIPINVHERRLGRSRAFPGDVLMNIVGPPLGKVSIVPASYPEWNFNQAIVSFRPVPPIDPAYMASYFLSNIVTNWTMRSSKATVGQFNISVNACRALPVPIAPLAEQALITKRIHHALRAVDSIEQSCRSSFEQIADLESSILTKAFRGELVLQDPNDEPTSVLHDRIHAERAKEQPTPRARKGRLESRHNPIRKA